MAKNGLSLEPHPYYPNDWLDKKAAEAYLKEHDLDTNLNLTKCRKMSLEVASTGHIRRQSLEFYVMLNKEDE